MEVNSVVTQSVGTTSVVSNNTGQKNKQSLFIASDQNKTDATKTSNSSLSQPDAVKLKTHVAKTVPVKPQSIKQLEELAQKYNIIIPEGEKIEKHQTEIVKAVVIAKSKEYNIPLAIAMGVSGQESDWTMWRNVSKELPELNRNKNDNGNVISTDWGVMQINDKSHFHVFPKVKKNLEANVEYGLKYLVAQYKVYHGSMGMGFGDWDVAIASYNLGSRPRTVEKVTMGKIYINRVRAKAKKLGLITTYEVKKGDSLALIAKNELGNSKLWTEIYELNKAKIDGIENLKIGAILELPKAK